MRFGVGAPDSLKFGIGAPDRSLSPLNSNVYSFFYVWCMEFQTVRGNQLKLTIHVQMAF